MFQQVPHKIFKAFEQDSMAAVVNNVLHTHMNKYAFVVLLTQLVFKPVVLAKSIARARTIFGYIKRTREFIIVEFCKRCVVYEETFD